MTGARDLVQGLQDENVMEIGEVQSVFVGVLNEAVSRRSACVVESFEGVSLKAPRRSYGCYEREFFFFAGSVTPVVCDAGLREKRFAGSVTALAKYEWFDHVFHEFTWQSHQTHMSTDWRNN